MADLVSLGVTANASALDRADSAHAAAAGRASGGSAAGGPWSPVVWHSRRLAVVSRPWCLTPGTAGATLPASNVHVCVQMPVQPSFTSMQEPERQGEKKSRHQCNEHSIDAG